MRGAVATWMSLGLGLIWVATSSRGSGASVPRAPVAAMVEPTSRISVPVNVSVGTGSDRNRRLAELVDESSSLGRSIVPGLVVRPRIETASSNPELEIVELQGAVAGVPLAFPLGWALVDLRDQGAVRVLSRRGTVPSRNVPIRGRLTAQDAASLLSGSGLDGSRGVSAADAQSVIANRPGWMEPAWRFDPPLDRDSWVNRIFLVGADTGRIEILREQAAAGWGRVFPVNPVTTPIAEARELTALSPGAQTLTGPWLQAKSCVAAVERPGCTPEAVAFADESGNFSFEPPDVSVRADNIALSDPFAEVSVFYHVQAFATFLQELGFAGIPCVREGQGATVVSNWVRSIENGDYEPFDNALYTGQCDFTMVFGQGASIDFAYEGDVIYHEYAHGVIEAQSGGQLAGFRQRAHAVTNDAGAIGEAVADYLSSAYAGDPLHGDYAARYSSDFVARDLDNDLVCPSALTGSIHDDSELFSGALWEAHLQFGGDAFAPVVIDSLALFPEDVQFEEATQILVEVTRAALGEAEATWLLKAFRRRNLERCSRIVPWGELERGLRLSPPSIVGLKRRPPPVQLSVEVPQGARQMELSLDFVTAEQGGTVAVSLRSGSPITFDYRSDETGTSVRSDEDDRVRVERDRVMLDVVPGTKLYLALENPGLREIVVANVDCVFRATEEQTAKGCRMGNPGGSQRGVLAMLWILLTLCRPRRL